MKLRWNACVWSSMKLELHPKKFTLGSEPGVVLTWSGVHHEPNGTVKTGEPTGLSTYSLTLKVTGFDVSGVVFTRHSQKHFLFLSWWVIDRNASYNIPSFFRSICIHMPHVCYTSLGHVPPTWKNSAGRIWWSQSGRAWKAQKNGDFLHNKKV